MILGHQYDVTLEAINFVMDDFVETNSGLNFFPTQKPRADLLSIKAHESVEDANGDGKGFIQIDKVSTNTTFKHVMGGASKPKIQFFLKALSDDKQSRPLSDSEKTEIYGYK